MKKLFLQFILLCSGFVASAQFTVNVPPSTLNDSTFVVPFGMTDSIVLPSAHYHRFYVCDNAQLILNGMMSSSMVKIYLEGSAKVVLQDQYFYPTIYMKTGAFVDAKGGSQNIMVHRESMAYFTDTANANFWYDSVYTSVNFTYVGWPGATKPCSLVSSVNASTKDLGNFNIFNNKVSYSLYNDQAASLSVMDISGKRIKVYPSLQKVGSIYLGDFAQGIYLLKFTQNRNSQVVKMLIE